MSDTTSGSSQRATLDKLCKDLKYLTSRADGDGSQHLMTLRNMVHQISQINSSLKTDIETPHGEPLEPEQIILRTLEVQALCEQISTLHNSIEQIILSVSALNPTVTALEKIMATPTEESSTRRKSSTHLAGSISNTSSELGSIVSSDITEQTLENPETLILEYEELDPEKIRIFQRTKKNSTDWGKIEAEDFISQGLFEKCRKLRTGLVEFRNEEGDLLSIPGALAILHQAHEDKLQKRFFSWCNSIKSRQMLQLMIIDDDKATRSLLQVSIKKTNPPPKMFLFPDALEAIQLMENPTDGFSQEKPTLILLDLFMPQMDGMEFLQKLQDYKLAQYSKVFMLTGSTKPEHREQALQLGATAFLQKSNLYRQIQDIVNLVSAHQRQLEPIKDNSMGIQVF